MTKNIGTFGHAIRWAYATAIGRRGLSLLVMFVLAAVLGPREFGLVAMASAYVLLIEMLTTQGLTSAIIQRRDLHERHLSSVFWIVIGASVFLGGLGVLLSPLWAAVNRLPELAPVISVLSLLVPLKGLGLVQRALLQREMHFRTLAVIAGVSTAISGAIGIWMAFTGWGVWSLVAQQVIMSALSCAMLWKCCWWWPRVVFSWPHARELLGFSSGVFAGQCGLYAASISDVVIMGIFFGPVAVGVYRMAIRLTEIMLEIGSRSIQKVALPHFSRLQDDPVQLRKAILSCTHLSAVVMLPTFAVLAATSPELMAILGDKWEPAATVLRIVVLIGITDALTVAFGALLLAKGRTVILAVIQWTLGVATMASLALVGWLMMSESLDAQILAIAWTRTGSFVLVFGVIALVMTMRLGGVSLRSIGEAVGPSIAAASVAILVVLVIGNSVRSASALAIPTFLMVAVPASLAACLTLVALDARVRGELGRVLLRPSSDLKPGPMARQSAGDRSSAG